MSFEYLEYCLFILGIRRCMLLATEYWLRSKLTFNQCEDSNLLKFVQNQIRTK